MKKTILWIFTLTAIFMLSGCAPPPGKKDPFAKERAFFGQFAKPFKDSKRERMAERGEAREGWTYLIILGDKVKPEEYQRDIYFEAGYDTLTITTFFKQPYRNYRAMIVYSPKHGMFNSRTIRFEKNNKSSKEDSLYLQVASPKLRAGLDALTANPAVVSAWAETPNDPAIARQVVDLVGGEQVIELLEGHDDKNNNLAGKVKADNPDVELAKRLALGLSAIGNRLEYHGDVKTTPRAIGRPLGKDGERWKYYMADNWKSKPIIQSNGIIAFNDTFALGSAIRRMDEEAQAIQDKLAKEEKAAAPSKATQKYGEL